MENKTPNRSIECSVKQCRNHCGYENFCALDKICVSTHEKDPKIYECTDCESFVKNNEWQG